VRGNHDKVVAGIEQGENFNHAALAAARWTAEHLTPGNLRFVRELPRGPVDLPEGLTICHGSPLDEDQYLFSIFEAWDILGSYPADLVFFGHTHVPRVFACADARRSRCSTARRHDPHPAGERLINRFGRAAADRDPRASYMTYDRSAHGALVRIPYPVGRSNASSRACRVLADRLALGV
jgi:diadenosine tetraphosphatase ApaH/serine/threonine PP2A family protein phosphatase